MKAFIKENPKYEHEKFVWHKMTSGEIIVNADNIAVKAFLEKETLGRETKSRDKEKEPEVQPTEEDIENQRVRQATEHVNPGQRFTDGEYEYTFTDRGHVCLNRYVGSEKETKLPEGVVVNGEMHPVKEMMIGAFAGTPVEQITINALYWNNAMYNPSCFITGSTEMPFIKWENLTPEQEQQLDRNRQWAKNLKKDEYGIPIEDRKEPEPEKEQEPEQEKPKKKDKDMDR